MKLPKEAKCMISKLPIDFKLNTRLARPSCGNMMEKSLLENWLTHSNKCPVCLKEMQLEDFPIVKIKS